MKAIYMPKGAAGEYAKYACNFYKGCSNGCTYCYLQRGVLKHACGGNKPVLKSCFKDERDAMETYFKELFENCDEYGVPNSEFLKHGIFFTFTSDPCLPQTMGLNIPVMDATMDHGVPVRMLTKCTAWIDTTAGSHLLSHKNAKELLSVGFTLTGRDDMEPNAAPNAERIKAMKRIYDMGISTWASIEPVIDLESSKRCIINTLGFCDEYKIGLLTGGKRNYSKEDVTDFVMRMTGLIADFGAAQYWKESVSDFVRKTA